MAPTPGILFVTMKPKPELPTAQFQDWWFNEHGPLRLRLPFFENGFIYRATDLEGPGKGKPEWLAIYDVTDTAELVKEPYTTLRTDKIKSQREKDTMKQISVGRVIYDYVGGQEVKGFKRLEEVKEGPEENVLVTVSLSLQPGRKKEELDKWYEEKHIPMLTKVTGWRRSRQFVTSAVERKDEIEYLTVHEYAPKNGLGGEEWKAATSTPWQEEIMTKVVGGKSRRMYDLFLVFGPAPRYLSALSSMDAKPFVSPDKQTMTMPISNGPYPAIESYITMKDGAVIPYRLEGSSDPDALVIVLSNSILVDWGIWNGFCDTFFSNPGNKKYRVLRYLTRGRSSNYGKQAITLEVLTSDVVALLDALRIPKASAVIGVSLGGATVLNTALKYPERVAAFVSCDTNANSPAGNRKAWEERIAIAEKEGAIGQTSARVVGEQLAEATVKRWFVKEHHDGTEIGRVKAMVEKNDLEGFKRSVEALYEYDVRSQMKDCEVKGAFVVGSGDGVLPGTMKEMAEGLGKGAVYKVIDEAGHLPMVEQPQAFASFVTEFLAGT
ncbi:hypothetical protein MMC13_007998 [Lambiella insularis]|nr:hypothetical protein [Lambiella insularis]